MEWIKKAKWAYIAASSILVLLGVFLILWPETSALTLCYIMGAIITLFGIVKIVDYFCEDLYKLAFQFDLALGLFLVIVGILMLIRPAAIIKVIPIVTGVFILLDGAFKVQTARDARLFGLRRWWTILLLALLTVAAGLLLILNPFEGAAAMMVLLGATFVVDGIQNFCVVAYTVRTTRANHQD